MSIEMVLKLELLLARLTVKVCFAQLDLVEFSVNVVVPLLVGLERYLARFTVIELLFNRQLSLLGLIFPAFPLLL